MTAALCLVACSDPSSPGDDGTVVPPPPGGLTYHRDLRALVEENCLSCHVTGGVGPFALDSYDAMKTYAPAVVASVEAKRMPPWLADPACRRYQEERILPEEAIGRFRRWMTDGLLEGDPSDYVPAVAGSLSPSEIGAPTLTLAIPEPYTPSVDRADDYRCFVLEHDFDEEMYLRTSHVVPGATGIVHHVILFLVPPQFAEQVDALDREAPGVGYPCFGGVGAGQPQPIAGWVPGTPIGAGSDEAAIRIPRGSKVVLQMHYNTLTAGAEPDQTAVSLWLFDQRPPYLLEVEFFPHLGIDIAAGDPASYHTREFVNRGTAPWTIVQTGPHMHLLGTRLRTTKVGADGSESCLVDVPRWDFAWQQGYTLRAGEEMIVAPGERLRLECWYDNSERNQPIVNGVQLPPSQVTWGEGTLDEMCLNTLVFVEPYAPLPEPATVCAAFQPCYDQCEVGNLPLTGCMLQCGAGDLPCAECVLGGVIGCTIDDCGREADAMLQCFDGCSGQGQTCIPERCSNAILAFDACSAPAVTGGRCDASVRTCNVVL
jgi:hypothetical protein